MYLIFQIEELIESLNYDPNIEWNGDSGFFDINNKKFVATIQPISEKDKNTYLPFFDHNLDTIPNIGNVTFSRIIEDGSKSERLFNDLNRKEVLYVFSGVAKIAAKLMGEHDYKILLNVAKEETRINAYNKIIGKVARLNGFNATRISYERGIGVFIAYHPKYENNILKIKKYMEENFGITENFGFY